MTKLYIFLIVLALSFTPLTNAYSKELPLEHFIKEGDYLDMQLSPDGKHIAARVNANGEVNLLFLDTATMKVVGGVRPQNNDDIHSVQWVSSERVVYQYAEKTHRLDTPTATGELFATDIDGSKHEMIFGYRAGEKQTGSRIEKKQATAASADIISMFEDDDKYILITEYPWTLKGNTYYDLRDSLPVISRINILSGRKRQIEKVPFPGAKVFATAKGDVLYAKWIGRDSYTKAAYRASNDAEWIILEGEDANYIPAGLSKDGSKVYLRAHVGEKAFSNLFELDVKTGNRRPLFDDLNADIEYVNYDPASDMPAVGISYPGKTQYHYLEESNRTAKYHKALMGAFGGQDLSIVSQSDNGKLLLVRVSSSVNPGEYYIFDTVTNGANFLWANRSWMDPADMNPKQPIAFNSSDGKEIYGFLTLPKTASDENKAPLVVYIHGGPHSRDHNGFDSSVQLLANRGYAVLQVNFRGSEGHGLVYEHAGYKEWGGKMIQDILDGTQYAVSNYPIDSNKMCTYGASYGGYAALMSVARATDMFKCAIGYVGVYDLNLMYTDGNVSQKLFFGRAYLEKTIGTDKAQLDDFSPVNYASAIKANVMLIHGEKDTQVPVIHSERMLEKFKQAGKEVPYLNFTNSGHGVGDEEGRQQLYTAILEFLDENIAK